MSLEPVCDCRTPKPDWTSHCKSCGSFACGYAENNRPLCPEWRCDCFAYWN